MRALPAAKSRLRAATSGASAHARLVDAIRNDTLAAVAASTHVARIVLALDRPWAATTIAHETYIQQGRGLNAAVAEAQVWAWTRWESDGVAALVGDLPALRSNDLDAALERAADHDRCYFPDMWGLGTTMLTARPGVQLQPAFGPQSGHRHYEIAVLIVAAPSLQCDVDTVEDLEIAVRLGVGAMTTAFLADEPVVEDRTGR
jgi:2-phospho-L-lactate guanylyltransferase